MILLLCGNKPRAERVPPFSFRLSTAHHVLIYVDDILAPSAQLSSLSTPLNTVLTTTTQHRHPTDRLNSSHRLGEQFFLQLPASVTDGFAQYNMSAPVAQMIRVRFAGDVCRSKHRLWKQFVYAFVRADAMAKHGSWPDLRG